MRLCYWVVLGLLSLGLQAKEKKYPVGEIPEDLRQGAYAVVRAEHIDFEVQNPASGLYTKTYAITILNGKGKSYGYFVYPYFGKISDLLEFKGTVYNAAGEEIDKIKKSDLEDRSSFDGFSVYSDSRYQYTDYSHHEYPYTCLLYTSPSPRDA